MIREIVTYPHPVLHQKAKQVAEVNDEIRELLADMKETMVANNGVGLAAPQIAVSLQVAIVDVEQGREASDPSYIQEGYFELINPQITDRQDEIEWEEGCLSVPNFWQNMQRSRKITVQYLDRQGKKQTLKAEGLLAVAIQQELDHLSGKLIIDQVSRLKQTMYLHRIKKEKRKNKNEQGD
ncbi:MAG: peptide deformylase [Pseudomonadota bacterium]